MPSILTIHSDEDGVVHVVARRGDFMEAFAQREAKLMNTLVLEALCGRLGKMAERLRDPVTCLECLALYDHR